MTSNVLLTLFLVALALPMLPQVSSAQAIKLGFVNDEKIKLEYKAWQKAQETWNVESKSWEEEAVAQQDELESLIEEYEKQKLILSEEKKREKEATINTKRDALDSYTKDIYGPGGKAERRNQQLTDQLLQNIAQAIESVAIEDNYDVIFTLGSGLGYIKESFDVTDKVLQKLDEME